MASIPEIVDNALRSAGIPILGISFGNESDRLTWSIRFDPSATQAQRDQAASILATVAVDAAAQHTQDQTDVKAFVANLPLIEKAIDLTILDQVNFIRARLPTPLGAITPAQWIAAVQAKVDTL